ncbi:MAG: 2,3-bisphosphoglycerate-independent phosphoglycerate mutase, partial [Clostridiales bacterium]|nr:2,3-bisphosphoglycerate-independent phosphoglycerate mutase [Clostridiales bacterium]
MKKTDAIIIMDGFGLRGEERGNAIRAAGTPHIDALTEKYPHTQIEASGKAVGLPAGQMGNSEVGHLNLGAGRVVYQDISLIDHAIETGEFFANEAFTAAAENVKKHGTAMHLIGLTSDGGVHSHIEHLYALLRFCKQAGVKDVYIHCVTDGRDVPPDSARAYVKQVEEKAAEIGVGKVATVVGRYYYMDRDNRWERVKRGYDCVFAGEGNRYTAADAGIAASYAAGVLDEFIEPVVVSGYKGVQENDSMIFYNFRSDRAREITRAAIYPDFDMFERAGGYKKICYVGMTQYDATFTGLYTAFAPKKIVNTLGEY